MTFQHEAAQIFGWTSEDTMDDDDNGCNHTHESGGTCSCTIALEIECHGLFSTLHCQFTVSGKSGCLYSHVELICVCLFFAHNMVKIFWNLVSFVGVSRGSRWEIYRQLNLHLLTVFFCRRISLPNLHATCHRIWHRTFFHHPLSPNPGAYICSNNVKGGTPLLTLHPPECRMSSPPPRPLHQQADKLSHLAGMPFRLSSREVSP